MVVVLILQTVGIKIVVTPFTDVKVKVAAWFRKESLGFFGRRDVPAQVRQAPDNHLRQNQERLLCKNTIRMVMVVRPAQQRVPRAAAQSEKTYLVIVAVHIPTLWYPRKAKGDKPLHKREVTRLFKVPGQNPELK